MNSDWQAFFSKPRAVHRCRGKGDWFCSGCFRDFARPCNAALHLKQSSKCRNRFSMIFTLKGDNQDSNIQKNAEIEKPEPKVPEEMILYPAFLHVDREEVKDEIVEEINETKIVRATRLGKKNWGPGYIIRVFDWCMARKAESDNLGKRALSRLGSEFWRVPEKTVYRWL